jgi:hypothetical protein
MARTGKAGSRWVELRVDLVLFFYKRFREVLTFLFLLLAYDLWNQLKHLESLVKVLTDASRWILLPSLFTRYDNSKIVGDFLSCTDVILIICRNLLLPPLSKKLHFWLCIWTSQKWNLWSEGVIINSWDIFLSLFFILWYISHMLS